MSERIFFYLYGNNKENIELYQQDNLGLNDILVSTKDEKFERIGGPGLAKGNARDTADKKNSKTDSEGGGRFLVDVDSIKRVKKYFLPS